nr:hypothetical protein [Synechococcus sp. PCC 6312]
MNSAKRPGLETKRVNVDFPVWIVEALDKEGARLGVHRQAIIKTLSRLGLHGYLDAKVV